MIWGIIYPRNATNTTMANIQADLFQLFRHTWSTIAAQAKTGLFVDMGQRDQIRPLSAAGWAAAERTQTT